MYVCSFLLVFILIYVQGRLCIYELMAEESAVNYWEVSSEDIGDYSMSDV